MASQTQTLRRGPMNASRTHDYLYDNHFVLSSERDHARATFKAHTGTSRVKRVPVYKTMFSELRHHPRFQMRLDYTDPVPKFISRQWRGYADQQREALIRHTTFNYDPAVSVPPQHFPDPEVGGRNRHKYFKRPIIPFLQQVPPEVLLATARQDPLATAEQLAAERPVTPATKTIETQTDYRDSEAQTDPYTPEYVIRPGSAPELLTLATLSFGRGLPAGLAEVEMIERARAKRAWEATLPPLSDLSQVEKRRRMMEEMECKEWALREQEIEKLQEARLEVLKQLLKQREENHHELNTKRLDKLWSKKEREKERKVKKLKLEHVKIIRKLTKKRKNVEGRLERKNIIDEYTDPGSQVYAPITRIGVFLDRGSEQYVVKSRYLNSYQGLLELEASLPDFVMNPRIKAPKPKTVTKAGFIKRKYRQDRELTELYEGIKEAKIKGEEPAKPLRFLKKIEKPIPRPPTPSIETPSWDEENKELAIIFLQQVLRGRSIQNMMYEGKEKRMELIRELRSTHALQEAQQLEKKLEMQTTLALQRQRRLHEHREALVDESLSQVEGQSLGDTLDFLSKELIRLQEERRIHAFSMLAERQRRIREAEESGRRQVEERRRREEDEIFKQMMSVHQVSVDTYLEDIILGSVDRTADLQARQEVEEMAVQINDAAYDAEETRTTLQSEEIVADLVHCFLLPEAQKQTIREKVHRSQRRFLLAAHKEIHAEGEDVIKMNAVEVKADISEQSTSTLVPTHFDHSDPNITSSYSGTSMEFEGDTPTRKESGLEPASQSTETSLGCSVATKPSAPLPEGLEGEAEQEGEKKPEAGEKTQEEEEGEKKEKPEEGEKTQEEEGEKKEKPEEGEKSEEEKKAEEEKKEGEKGDEVEGGEKNEEREEKKDEDPEIQS